MAQQSNHEQEKEVVSSTANKKQNTPVAEEDAPSTDPAAAPKETKTPPPKAAKKEKAPGVEDKPFADFIQQDYLPALQKALAAKGVKDIQLSFVKQKIPVRGMEQLGECWQIVGDFADGVRHFRLYFPDENIQGKKAFSCYEGKQPSVLESFLIDERKVTLELLIWGLLQRLDGQKWLGRN